MRNLHYHFSPLSICASAVGVLAVVYVGLVAVVMSYATLTVDFAQSVKNNEADVAVLEAQYLAGISRIQNVDYRSLGYAAITEKVFVPAASVTALR